MKSPLEKIAEERDAATLDRVMSKAPSAITGEDTVALVHALRQQRARFIAADVKKAERKEGIEDNEHFGDIELSDE